MKRVSDLVQKIFPKRKFVIITWKPGEHKTIVDMITNVEAEEVSRVLRKTAIQMTEDESMLPRTFNARRNLRSVIGHAAAVSVIYIALHIGMSFADLLDDQPTPQERRHYLFHHGAAGF